MFTALILSLLLGLSWGYHVEQEYVPESDLTCERMLDVAIVGAGPSGTYAAYKLRNDNLTIEIFDCSDHIGGRLVLPSLTSVPDISPELDAMRFAFDNHARVSRLMEALNLKKYTFSDGFGEPGNIIYYIRGHQLTAAEIKYGNVPYKLSPEEKANQANLTRYYLNQLTGFNESSIQDDKILKLKVKDGRKLYQLTIHEALDMVATDEGKEFVKATSAANSYFDKDASAANFFQGLNNEYLLPSETFTLEGGLKSLTRKMSRVFQETSSKHKIHLQRKLKAIRKTESGLYRLGLFDTAMKDGVRFHNSTTMKHVCAKKVILAVPHNSLKFLDWEPLRSPTLKQALQAVKPVKASEHYIVFPKSNWTKANSLNAGFYIKSEGPIEQICTWDLSKPSGKYVMAAMFADTFKSDFLENLNSEEKPIPGSAPSPYQMTFSLKQELVGHFSKALEVEKVPEPVVALSQFWSKNPYGGGWTIWRAGYNMEDVQRIIQRPSLIDDVYVVGSDHYFSQDNQWAETALKSVDDLFEKYF